MIKLNNSQIKGIAILIFAIIASFLLKNSFFQIIIGVLCAVGVSYILKFIPFKLRDLNFKPSKYKA